MYWISRLTFLGAPTFLVAAAVTATGVESKMLEVSPLPDGAYTLRVMATSDGDYTLDFHYQGKDYEGLAVSTVADIPIAAGGVHAYAFDAPIQPGQPLPLRGGFDGGGQRPRDVNKFLSYSTVSGNRTDLPAGTTALPLLIFYDAATLPGSFTAVLNGVPITSSFHPVSGGFESVSIPLRRGINTLQLTIDGNASGRVATDSNGLTFRVP